MPPVSPAPHLDLSPTTKTVPSRLARLAVIGCGLRSDCYLHQMRPTLGFEWQLAALADPNPMAVDVYRRNYHSSARGFATGPELLAAERHLDGIVIASPNAFHRESMELAVRRGIPVLLEKPVATTLEDCSAMWRAWQDADRPPVAVGFVLRYTAFYRKVRELLCDGALGQLLSIEATENLGAPLSALFNRTWRRLGTTSGPFLLEKCCHDLDLLNWFVGARARWVSSFASRTRFVPNPQAAMHCRDCTLAESCRYNSARIAPYLINGVRSHEILELLPTDNDLCVFNSDKDVPDHQVVNIEYENGVLASFSVSLDQPRTTRTIKVNGTQGQITGDIGRDYLRVEYHLHHGSETKTRTEEIVLQHDNSGHHGGDSVISAQFSEMLRGNPTPPVAGLREGIEAAVLALAAEQSVRSRSVVDAGELLAEVFQ